jgi:hypothetical protein
MRRHYSQHFKTRLQQQIRYGPLIVNLITDVGRQDNRDSCRLSARGSTAQGKNNYQYEEFDGNSQGLKYKSDGELKRRTERLFKSNAVEVNHHLKKLMPEVLFAVERRRKQWGKR